MDGEGRGWRNGRDGTARRQKWGRNSSQSSIIACGSAGDQRAHQRSHGDRASCSTGWRAARPSAMSGQCQRRRDHSVHLRGSPRAQLSRSRYSRLITWIPHLASRSRYSRLITRIPHLASSSARHVLASKKLKSGVKTVSPIQADAPRQANSTRVHVLKSGAAPNQTSLPSIPSPPSQHRPSRLPSPRKMSIPHPVPLRSSHLYLSMRCTCAHIA